MQLGSFLIFGLVGVMTLTGCSGLYLPQPTGQSLQEVHAAQYRAQAIEDAHYQRERKKRQDLIQDTNTLQRGNAQAIKEATQNADSSVIIVH